MERNEELNKSIDELIDAYFVEPEEEESFEKADSSYIAEDSEETADEAVGKAPKMQKDEARGAGRSRDIHDQPQVDNDGKREKAYDDGISNDQKEDEPDESDQVAAVDQTSSKGRMSSKPAKPKMRPFMKSESGEEVEISEEEYAEFQAFKKSQEEAAKEEELKKARSEQEDLIKSAVNEALRKSSEEIEELKKSLSESNALIKAMAKQPREPKSVTGISALQKSVDPETEGPKSFSKSEMLDAAEELAKSKSLPMEAVIELENTGYISNPEYRKLVEKQLLGE